jgi:hypothetical protein
MKIIKKVKLPQQELGASFNYKQKTSLSPSGCRYISRQESGVLCGSIKPDLEYNCIGNIPSQLKLSPAFAFC